MKIRAFTALLALAAAGVNAQSQAIDETAAPFAGLWASRNAFGPELAGELVVRRNGDGWHGSIDGFEGSSSALDIAFPGDRGRFRGALVDEGRAIEGWWIQPRGLPGQAYATPLRLETAGADSWRGTVVPLPQTFTLFLHVLRNEEGRWIGAFRNPEFNLGATRLFASRSGDRLAFSTPEGALSRQAAIVGDGARLDLDWPPVPRILQLARAADTADYLPRDRGSYAYAPPPETGDGWRTARAADVGFDEAALAGIVERIADADPSVRRPQLIHALLVARRGRLVLEEYFHGFNREQPHDLRSVGKAFASILLGAAMQEGMSIGPDQRIYHLLASRGPFDNPDPRKARITLAHLMTHASGLACNDNDEASPGNEGNMQGQADQPDWSRYVLDLPMVHEPGARYAYCSGGINLVGSALREVSGLPVPDLFDRLIARPLQFGRYHWNLMPSGEAYLGGGMFMRPRDLLKLGQFYLDGGVWNGRRIVRHEWVARSTAAQIEVNEHTTGMDAATFANVATRGADGYGWHRYGVRVGERVVEAYEANGNGGQLLLVVPEFELVVVIMGGNYGQGAIWTRWRNDIIGAQLIPALSPTGQ